MLVAAIVEGTSDDMFVGTGSGMRVSEIRVDGNGVVAGDLVDEGI